MNLLEKPDICAHLGCTCTPRIGNKYCSDWCEQNEALRRETCGCGHQGCTAIGVLTDEGLLQPDMA